MISLSVCKSPRCVPQDVQVQHDPVAAAHAQVLAALATEPLRLLPICPQASDVEECGTQLRDILRAVSIYLSAILEHVAQNVPRDLDLRQIEALYCDLTSEVAGTLKLAAAALPGRRS